MSLCQQLKESYETLQAKTADFLPRYAGAKDTGDLTEVKHLKKDLEMARDALREQLLVFVVPNAANPYREALLEAGISGTEALVAEKKDIVVNIEEEIEKQTARYAECKDKDGKPALATWGADIISHKDRLFAEVAKEYAKIQERINAGMVPIIMPSRSVQEASWKEAMTNLKPISRNDSKSESVNDAYLYDGYENEKMDQDNFFKDIPDRPYIVWTKPSQKPDQATRNKTFENQQKYLQKLAKDSPALYATTDMIPTEYAALQMHATHRVVEEYKEYTKAKGAVAEPKIVKPLDYDTYTRFLSSGAFSGGSVPLAYFYPLSGNRRVEFSSVDVVADARYGFRPVARS